MVLSRSWTYGKHYLSICRWKLGFDPTVDLNKKVSMWVRTLGLPLEFWDEKIFRWIGSTFGHYVATNNVTKDKSRLVYTCFFVNVVKKTLPNFITLQSNMVKWTQVLVYENATIYFQKCSKSRHIILDCKAPLEKKLKFKEIWSSPPVEEHKIDEELLEEGIGVCPFTDGILKLMETPNKSNPSFGRHHFSHEGCHTYCFGGQVPWKEGSFEGWRYCLHEKCWKM